jgi:hypothetical protein
MGKRGHKTHLALAFAVLLVLLSFAPAARAAPEVGLEEQIAVTAPAPVAATPADAVVESIGVNTHLGYTDTPYNDFALVRQRLRELGIRYIRDSVSQDRPDVYAKMRELAGDGVHLDAIAGDPLQRWNIGTIDQQLDLIQKELTSSVISIEGPNEYDLQGDPDWISILRSYTQQLSEGVRARPGLAALPVLCPSIVRRENMAATGDLSPWCDYGNTHTYLSGEMPERDSIWDGELAAAANNSAAKPVQVTETGYHNGVNGTVGHLGTSELASGIYMPRLFLENFRRGLLRSYAYELLDQREDPSKTDIEAAFGLLRNDFSKKPAAVAVERLIGLLSDRGASFKPTGLAYRLEGAPATARQLLLQKRDGSFDLVLWNAVSVWDTEQRVDTNPPDVPVTLTLGEPIAGAEVFEPNTSADPVATFASPTSVALDLSERVTVVKLVPPAAVPPPPPVPEPEPEPTPAPEPEPSPLPLPVPPPPRTGIPTPPSAPPRAASVTAPASATAPPPASLPAAPAAPAATAPEPPVAGPVNRSHRTKTTKKHRKRQHRHRGAR